MKTAHEHYAELIALTSLYLGQRLPVAKGRKLAQANIQPQKISQSPPLNAPARLESPSPIFRQTPASPAITPQGALSQTQPPPKPIEIDDHLDDIKKVVIQQFPLLKIVDKIPDDTLAKKKKSKSPSIIILSFDDHPQHLEFLGNVSRAIESLGHSAQVIPAARIERENRWEGLVKMPGLKLVLVPRDKIALYPVLKQAPLLLLLPISLYLQDSSHKAVLWKTIKGQLTSKGSS